MPPKKLLALLKHKSIRNIVPLKENGSKETKSDDKVVAPSSVSSSNNNANQNPAKNPISTSKNEDRSIQMIYMPTDRKSREIHGFDSEIMSLQKLLGSREGVQRFKAIGVVGKCGVGKTTLCQEFYCRFPAEECLKEMGWSTFVPRVWVSVPKPDNREEGKTIMSQEIAVLERMLKSLGFEEEKIEAITSGVASSESSEYEKLMVLLYVLRLQVVGKKYLIVLDGVQNFGSSWYENLLESKSLPSNLDSFTKVFLTSALPKESGGTVIFTCREETTAKKMVECGNLHRVLPLISDDTSLWKIFGDAVKLYAKLDVDILKNKIMLNCEELQFLGRNIGDIIEKSLHDKVVSKCKGLPLVAILMAETMPKQLERMETKKEEERKKEELRKAKILERENIKLRKGDDQGRHKVEVGKAKVPIDEGPKGETKDGKTPMKKEEKEHKGKVEEKEEAKERGGQTQEVVKHDAEANSKGDSKKDEQVEAEKIPEEAKHIQGEDHGHDATIKPSKKGDDQKAKGNKEEASKEAKEITEVQEKDHVQDSKVEPPQPPKKDDDQKAKEKKEEAKETEVQEEDRAKVESPKKDDTQREMGTKDHDFRAPKKEEEEAPKQAKETQVQGEDHGHDAEFGSPEKDDNQKEMKTKDHEVIAPTKQEETLKESKETKVQAEASEKKEELLEKK